MLKLYYPSQKIGANKLAELKSQYGSWGKLTFSDLTGLHGAFAQLLGEKVFKKILIAETSSSYLMPADSEAEQQFQYALKTLDLENYFDKPRSVMEKKDPSVSQVVMTLPTKDLQQSGTVIPPGPDSPAIYPVDKIPKGKILQIFLEKMYGEVTSPETIQYLKSNREGLIISSDLEEVFKSIFSVNCSPVILKTKKESEIWYLVEPNNADQFEDISKRYFSGNHHGLLADNYDELKHTPSRFLTRNTVLVNLSQFEQLCKLKIIPQSLSRWVDPFGHWSIAFF